MIMTVRLLALVFAAVVPHGHKHHRHKPKPPPAPPMSRAVASWYNDSGMTASGRHYLYGFASLMFGSDWGHRIRFCYRGWLPKLCLREAKMWQICTQAWWSRSLVRDHEVDRAGLIAAYGDGFFTRLRFREQRALDAALGENVVGVFLAEQVPAFMPGDDLIQVGMANGPQPAPFFSAIMRSPRLMR